ncbi:MAG: glutamate racemase [Alphaproteobacteria bacterium]|nr:glutamate racemase [Alphaproteobacteria bacterium]
MTRIAIFDSGIGGLTVFSEIAKVLPQADLLYFADNAAFPYGRFSDDVLVERVTALADRIIHNHAPDMVVLACNTASTLCLPVLRAQHPSVIFVGTVPAIKPAVAVSKSRKISVLATPATVRRDYTKALISEHAQDCTVHLVACPSLAEYAEAELRGEPVEDALLLQAISPAFQEGTDAIVLACTHYPLLLPRMKALAPWPVEWIDSAPAIARRAASLAENNGDGIRCFYYTAPCPIPDALKPYGFSKAETEALPFPAG